MRQDTSTSSSATKRSWPYRSAPSPPPGRASSDPTVVPTDEGHGRRFGRGGPTRRHGRRRHRPGGPLPLGGPYCWRSTTRPPRSRLPAPTTTGWPATAPRRPHACSARPCCRCRTRRGRPRAAKGGHRARLSRRIRPPQPLSAAATLPPFLRRGLVGRRGVGRGRRSARGELGHCADARGGPTVQSPHPPRRLPLLRGDARLRPARGVRRLRPPPRALVRVLGVSGGWLPFWLERLDEQAESSADSART